jgi:hypothetical protein
MDPIVVFDPDLLPQVGLVAGFLGKIGKFIGKAVANPIRGIGRIARGDFKAGLGDIAGGAARLGAMALPVAGIAGLSIPGIGALGGGLGKIGKIGGAALNFLKDNPELALGGLGMYQASKAQGQGDEYMQSAIDRMRARDEQTAPLRDMVISGLQQGDPEREDLSSLFAGSQNPFSARGGQVAPAVPTGGGGRPPGGLAALIGMASAGARPPSRPAQRRAKPRSGGGAIGGRIGSPYEGRRREE